METGDRNTTTRRADREIISISLPVSLYERFKLLCERESLNRSAVISAAIRDYLDRRDQDGKI